MTTYNALPFICPKCYNASNVLNVKHKGNAIRRFRQCSGCERKFYTYDLGAGERFDCWYIEGQSRNTIEYRAKVLTFKRVALLLRKKKPGPVTEIAIAHIRQGLGIPTPLNSRQE